MKKIAFIYPGQGAQYPGMGKDIYENYEVAKNIIDGSNEILGFDLKDIVFDGSEEDIKKTEITQPAILMVSHAVSEVLKENGIVPEAVAGLSLGEYSALVDAGVIEYGDALQLVRKRGTLMEEAVPAGKGAMSAILGLSAEEIEEALEKYAENGIIKIANYNCPGQLVISGEKALVEEASEELKEKGARRAVILPVSGPFHTEMLDSAGEKLRDEIKKIDLNEPDKAVYFNVTGEKYSGEDIEDTLVKQVSSSVRWEDIIRNMINDGIEVFVEVGVGKTLVSFVKKIAKEMKADVETYNVQEKEDIDKLLEKIK